MSGGLIETLRGPRIAGMAIFDWVMSLLLAWVIGRYALHLSGGLAWSLWIVDWVLLGLVVHRMLGINTMFGYYMGMNARPREGA